MFRLLYFISFFFTLVIIFSSLDLSIERYSSDSSIDVLPDEIFMKVCMKWLYLRNIQMLYVLFMYSVHKFEISYDIVLLKNRVEFDYF